MTTVSNSVRERRTAAGLRQEALAARVGLSRQSLSGIEAGRRVPSTAIALRLSHELGCKVEELFWTEDQSTAALSVELSYEPADRGAVKATSARRQPAGELRAVLASVAGRWVAHPLSGTDSATFQTAGDALLSAPGRSSPRRAAGRTTARARWLSDPRRARETLLCAGCAPAFGILTARANDGRDDRGRFRWLDRSSDAALELLAREQVHVAGAHLFDEQAGEFNVPFVRRRLPQRAMLLFQLARWESGLAVASGNPKQLRGVRDLARPDVRFVQRQPGAAAQEMLHRLLRHEDIPSRFLQRAPMAQGHLEVARLIALGVADAGITLRAIARAQGLDFLPLAEERFDLVIDKSFASDPRAVHLLETACGHNFRRELDALGGHVTRDTGKLIADTSQAA